MSPAAPAAAVGTLEREVAKLVADVLQAEMVLDDAHCVLGNQKWDIPADKELFVAIFDQAGPVIGTANFFDADPASSTLGKEIQQSAVMHDVRIEIMSFDASARLRKEEVSLALASIFSQQLQSKYRVQIARAQTPVDASDTEVTGRLQKFVVHVNVTALHQKVKDERTGTYYDKFNGATVDGTAKPPRIVEQP